MKRFGVVATVLGMAALLAIGVSVALASTTPRWVKHAHHYPGGISNGVRAYLAPGMREARQQARDTGASEPGSAGAGCGRSTTCR